MTELQTFTNEQLGVIRTLTIEGEPWFVGKDVAEILGYGGGGGQSKSVPNAIKRHVDEEDKGVTEMMTPGGKQNMTIINESGLYALILSSKLPQAKTFKRWVTSEVLPQIRKTGGYIPVEQGDTDLEIMVKAFAIQRKTIEQKDELISELAPKALFADAVSASSTCILVGEMAKLLKQNSVDIGQNRMFDWLRENGYLMKRKGSDYNMPTQASMEKGILAISENVKHHKNGSNLISKTTMVTGKGQIYFANKFLTPGIIA